MGDMKWNPQSLWWEGNDQVLCDFDMDMALSTCPVLITHLTGSLPVTLRMSMDLYPRVWVTYPRVLTVAKVIPASLGKIDMGY